MKRKTHTAYWMRFWGQFDPWKGMTVKLNAINIIQCKWWEIIFGTCKDTYINSPQNWQNVFIQLFPACKQTLFYQYKDSTQNVESNTNLWDSSAAVSFRSIKVVFPAQWTIIILHQPNKYTIKVKCMRTFIIVWPCYLIANFIFF